MQDESILTTAMPSWRGMVDSVIWDAAPAVILLDRAGRANTWEIYIHGSQVGRSARVADAKAIVEARVGPCSWEAHNTGRVTTDHYYFGPTDEFTDPPRAYLGTPLELTRVSVLDDAWALS